MLLSKLVLLFLITEWYSSLWTFYSVSPFTTEEHLGDFQFGAVRNQATMYVLVCVLTWMYLFISHG